MELPYTKVDAFKLGDTLYSTEQEVLFAALESHVGRSGVASTIAAKACQLAPLLTRLCEMGRQDEPPSEG